RPARGEREEVAVDPDRRARAREPTFHRRDRLPARDRAVREDRAEPVEADRARGADDVDRDGAVRCELDAVLVGDTREEKRRLGVGGRGEREREGDGDPGDGGEARHGPIEASGTRTVVLRLLQDPNRQGQPRYAPEGSPHLSLAEGASHAPPRQRSTSLL